MNVQGLTRNMWGTEADTLRPLISGLLQRRADIVCLQELGLLNSDIPEFQSRCFANGYTAFVAPLHLAKLPKCTVPSTSSAAHSPIDRRVLGRGVALLVKNELAQYAALVPCFPSHRAIAIRLLIRNVCRLYLLGLYAPTGSSAAVATERRKVLAGVQTLATDASTATAQLVVLGDLNEVADPSLDACPPLTSSRASPLCDLLRGPLSLGDTFRAVHPQTITTTWRPPGPDSTARRLDYIYASHTATVTAASVERANPLISTDHGIVSCTFALGARVQPPAPTHCETLLDPSHTADWGIEGRAAEICFTAVPLLTQMSWDRIVPLLCDAIDPPPIPDAPHEDGDTSRAATRLNARVSLSLSGAVAEGAVTVRVNHGDKNPATIALITRACAGSLVVDSCLYSLSAVTCTGWDAFSRALSANPIVSHGVTVLKTLIASTDIEATAAEASAAMGMAFSALTETLVSTARATIALAVPASPVTLSLSF